MNDFGQLFRHTPLVSVARQQIVKKALLKHTIHEPVKTMTIEAIDSAKFMRTHIRSGWARSESLKRYKELFHSTNPPFLVSSLTTLAVTNPPSKPIDSLSDNEWKEWIEYARSKRAEFKKKSEAGEIDSYDWRGFLGLNKIENFPVKTHPRTYQPPVDHYFDQRSLPVTGRIWSVRNESSYYCLVGGFLCTLNIDKIPEQFSRLRNTTSNGRAVSVGQQMEYSFKPLKVTENRHGEVFIELELLQTRERENMFSNYVAPKSHGTSKALSLDELLELVVKKKEKDQK